MTAQVVLGNSRITGFLTKLDLFGRCGSDLDGYNVPWPRLRMERLSDLIPDPDALLGLEPEELAGYLIEFLNGLPSDRQLNRYNLTLPSNFEGYPQHLRDAIAQAVMEAWVWLEREGLIAPKPGSQGEWVFVTRRGRVLKNHVDLAALRSANLLPRKMLHPVLVTKVWATFLRGDYDTAIFQAFKEVEVAVRTKGGFAATDFGIELMRKAFHTQNGPLTDTQRPLAEREALAHLFVGAIGSYKNPTSHRHLIINDPGEAVEITILASHLLRIVDLRKRRRIVKKTGP
jgi:uncharacterized protein (TIGR02391 family)